MPRIHPPGHKTRRWGGSGRRGAGVGPPWVGGATRTFLVSALRVDMRGTGSSRGISLPPQLSSPMSDLVGGTYPGVRCSPTPSPEGAPFPGGGPLPLSPPLALPRGEGGPGKGDRGRVIPLGGLDMVSRRGERNCFVLRGTRRTGSSVRRDNLKAFPEGGDVSRQIPPRTSPGGKWGSGGQAHRFYPKMINTLCPGTAPGGEGVDGGGHASGVNPGKTPRDCPEGLSTGGGISVSPGTCVSGRVERISPEASGDRGKVGGMAECAGGGGHPGHPVCPMSPSLLSASPNVPDGAKAGAWGEGEPGTTFLVFFLPNPGGASRGVPHPLPPAPRQGETHWAFLIY